MKNVLQPIILFSFSILKGPSIKYVHSNMVIFRHPLPPCMLSNDRITSQKQWKHPFALTPSLPITAYILKAS